MKRTLIPMLLVLLICAFVAACGGASGETTTSATDQEAAQLVPIYPNQIKESTYAITVSSSSSMFRIVDAQLIVKDGEMSAVLTLSGVGYEKLYMGTGEQALADSDDKCIYFAEDAEGKYTYQVPVEALDKEIDCAAWSINKEQWYDRVLVFESSQIPKDAIGQQPQGSDEQQGSTERPADGQYTIAVTLSGGSGKATVESPTELTIEDGAMTAAVKWSSPNYDFMMVDGTKYLPTNTGGNSTFEVPVSALDQDIAVSADTTAMSQPQLIDYTLRFDSSTLTAVGAD